MAVIPILHRKIFQIKLKLFGGNFMFSDPERSADLDLDRMDERILFGPGNHGFKGARLNRQ